MAIQSSKESGQIGEWCSECLLNQLYIRGRLAKGWMERSNQIPKMSILKEKEEIDGWAFAFVRSYDPIPFLNVFVKKELRGLGWATKLLENFVEDYNGPFEISNKEKKFYKKVKCLEGKLI